jgi:diaminopimelate epimerase
MLPSTFEAWAFLQMKGANSVNVTKMHALGNNYVYVSEFEQSLQGMDLPSLAVDISDVRRGIGSDGLIVMSPSTAADVCMRIFNADGSEAENCGNGLRCVAKYVFEHNHVASTRFTIEVKTGVVSAEVDLAADGTVQRVTVDMGEVSFQPADVGYCGPTSVDGDVSVSVDNQIYTGTLVSVGNPHFVSFVPDILTVPIAEVGPQIEKHGFFSNRINVEFVSPITRNELNFRVWERGSGITYACGTGACASVAAGIRKGLLDDKVTVHLLGGDLEIAYRDGHVWMTGEAVEVFTGQYFWPRAR